MPARCSRAFTGWVISCRAEDKVCPAFLSHITQGLLICFSPAVPTLSLSDAVFPAALFSHQRTDFLSPFCRLALGECSLAPQLCVPLTKLLRPAFLIPLLKEGVLSSPSKKLGRGRLSYSIGNWCWMWKTASPASLPYNSELENTHGAEIFSNIDELFVPDRKRYLN